MPGVPRELAEHQLKVFPNAKPVKQRLRRFTPKKREAIRAELTRLKAAGFIREVVDSTAGCALLSFLDCYSGYHQISLATEDQEKTAFITPFGAYCYTSMPFGLKNAGATYQRAIQACLTDHWGKSVEAHVDDVVIKTKNEEDFIDDLRKVFDSLRKFRWKLNPTKCVFGVPTGQLLGFVVSNRGIEANLEKIKAILRMHPPRSQKDVQRLTGCMAALSRFISRLGERGMPFYKLLKKVDRFQWTIEAQEALDALKKFLTSPPILKSPDRATADSPAEDLLPYISCMTHVVSTALVVERPDGQHTVPTQHSVYFISEVLSPSKIRYPQVQKLLYAVLITARKLRHYFEEHKIIVVIEFPIGEVLLNREATGHITKWACELGAHDNEFRLRTAIKTQAVVDFVSEWTEHQVPEKPEIMEVWKMYFDGSLKLEGAAEYEALLHSLCIAISLGIQRLMAYGDSLVVINQVNKEWDRSTESMDKYCEVVRKLEGRFQGIGYIHVDRDRNVDADILSKLGSSRAKVPSGIFVQELHHPSVQLDELSTPPDRHILTLDTPTDWRAPIIKYVLNEEILEDKAEAERIARWSSSYTLINNELYKRAASGVLLKCLSTSSGRSLLQEIHAGICGIHAASRTLVGKAFRAGFYWPTAKKDAAELVQHCEACQFLAKQHHLLAQQLQNIPVSWPFACWGLDMIGPFKKAQGGYTHVLVAIDKFTKWIEFKPIASLTSAKAVEFIQDIIFRFGIMNSIITDLGSNFTGSEFFDFCKQRSIRVKYVSVAHPRANGQVERANGMILDALKKKIFDKDKKLAGKWIRELPYVVWSLRTQPSKALAGNTPFFMVYGSEAVLPADLKFGTPHLVFNSIAEAEATQLEEIDLLEEESLNSVIQSARYQQTLRRYHDRYTRPRSFSIGDLVLRKVLKTAGQHKLSPPWEGPYIVTEVTHPGSYRLSQMDGTPVGNSWNIEHLRRFYA
ncbi:hypothetical protein U9M48_003554 [Paspalum notatum var. saurae]|uniref:Integrase catalytic domain-containing protein n=1 Tax=Paspalum notatum var. saurae TaxID=547442 RepID=A0AAQ3SJZ2_PASNO